VCTKGRDVVNAIWWIALTRHSSLKTNNCNDLSPSRWNFPRLPGLAPRPACTVRAWHSECGDVSPSLPGPVLPDIGSSLWCVSAVHSDRSLVLNAAFHYPAMTACLAAAPTTVSNAPGLHLQTRSGLSAESVQLPAPGLARLFLPSKARSLRVARYSVRFQTAPSVSAPPLPSRTSRSFGLVALSSAPAGEAYHCRLPDLLSLPAAPR